MTAPLALATGRIFGEILTRPTKNGGQVTFFKIKVTTATQQSRLAPRARAAHGTPPLLTREASLTTASRFDAHPWDRDALLDQSERLIRFAENLARMAVRGQRPARPRHRARSSACGWSSGRDCARELAAMSDRRVVRHAPR
jgi:hypothetical protein